MNAFNTGDETEYIRYFVSSKILIRTYIWLINISSSTVTFLNYL